MIQSIEPFFSPNIDKGELWHNKLSQELSNTKIGIICLTKTNREAAWIMYEAGVLAKGMGLSCVAPIAFDFPLTELKGPLKHFHGTSFNKDDVLKLMQTINTTCGDPLLKDKALENAFEIRWPELSRKVNAILIEDASRQEMVDSSDRNILIEILELSRSAFYNANPHKELMTNPILLSPIDDLEITTKTANILKSENTFYIGDLIQRTEKELLQIPSMNDDILLEINGMLARKGLLLGMQLEDWPPENLI